MPRTQRESENQLDREAVMKERDHYQRFSQTAGTNDKPSQNIFAVTLEGQQLY